MHILIKKKYLLFKEYRIKCSIGKRGIKKKVKEGDFVTPKGIHKIKLILYRKDRIKKFNTPIKKLAIKRNMGWCDDPNSNKYNKLIICPFNFNYEKLYRKENVYDIVIVLNYNMNPVIKKKGSAIFIHIARKNYKKTEGCVAIKKGDMLKIIQNLKSNTIVEIS